MLKKLTFGQYNHKNSIIHRLDPRTKIILVITLSAAAFQIKSYSGIILFTALIVSIVMLAKMRPSSILRNLRPFFFIFSFILLMYAFFSRNHMHEGILTIWKFTLFIVIASILTYTTTITNTVTAIERLLKPLQLVKINTRNFALLISLTIRFIPVLFLYAERVNDAQVSRLGNRKNIKKIKLFFTKLLDRMFNSASSTSDALESRNYVPERSYYFNVIRLRHYDYVFLILLLSFVIIF
jgi:energy-coupling factor transport system permease protein